MATPLDQYLSDNPDLAAVPRDELLRRLHEQHYPSIPYRRFAQMATAAAPADADLEHERDAEDDAGLPVEEPEPIAGHPDYATVAPKPVEDHLDFEAARQAVKNIESSGGDYGAIGPVTSNGDFAVGAYQVMASNIPDWTKRAFGYSMSVNEFRQNPKAQDRVFDLYFSDAYNKHGLEGAASTWFTGSPVVNDRKDQLGTSDRSYVWRFMHNYHHGDLTPETVKAAADEITPRPELAADEKPKDMTPDWVDPTTGITSRDMPSPEMQDRIVRGIGRGALGAAAGALRALDKPGEFIAGGFNRTPEDMQKILEAAGPFGLGDTSNVDVPNRGRDESEWSPRGVAKKLEEAIAPAPPPQNLAENVADIATGVIGGMPVSIATWMGRAPMAVLQGFDTAEQVAKSKGKEPTTGESLRDAGIEGLARIFLGKAAAMPWGRLTSGFVFGSEAGGQALVEGKDKKEAAIASVSSFLMGLLGRNITAGAQARVDAALQAARNGDIMGSLRYLNAAMRDPKVADAVNRAARDRGEQFIDPTGDAAARAAALQQTVTPTQGPQPRLPIVPNTRQDNPEARERAKSSISINLVQRDRRNAMIREHWETGEDLFKGVPDQTRIDMMTDYMRGDIQNIPQPWRDWFVRSRDVQENQFLTEKYGAELDYEWRNNYWHLQWKDPQKAIQAATSMPGGPPRFTKGKAFEDAQEGIDFGMELRTTNPAVLGVARSEMGNMALARIMAVKDFVKDGLAIPETELGNLKRLPADIASWGRDTVDVGGVRYRMHPQAKKMLSWSLGVDQAGISKLLGLDPVGRPAQAGRMLYQGWMTVKNATIPVKLSMSAFHALHILGIDAVQPYAAAIQQKLAKRVSQSEFLKAIRDHRAVEGYAYGRQASENFSKPYDQLTPNEKVDQDLMIAGGHTPQRPSVFEVGATRALRRQINDVIPSLQEKIAKGGAQAVAAAWRVPVEVAKKYIMVLGKGIEAMQHPMFADWIPAIKTAAYLNQAKLLVNARPELLSNHPQAAAALRQELQKIRRSIDNRFGEMQYDREFMHPTLKKALMASMLSVGWNYGFLREFGGGIVKDLPRSAYLKARNVLFNEHNNAELSTRTVYAASYVAQSLILGGLMTYMMTGDRPRDFKDLVYPKLPDGSRVTTMFFTRELGAMWYHFQNEGLQGLALMMAGKMQPAAQGLIDTLMNRDYFGNQVYDENADPFTQVGQAMTNFAKTVALPISLAGAASSPSGDPSEIALSFGGFGPAPKYVERPRTQSRILSAWGRLHEHTIAYGEREAAGDKRDLVKLYKSWQATGRDEDRQAYELARDSYQKKHPTKLGRRGQAMKQMENAAAKPQGWKMFSDLPAGYQEWIYKGATDEEKASLQSALKLELRDKYAFEVTPDILRSFSIEGQEDFLRTLKWDERDKYLPYVDPKVSELFWSFPPPPPPPSHHKQRAPGEPAPSHHKKREAAQ